MPDNNEPVIATGGASVSPSSIPSATTAPPPPDPSRGPTLRKTRGVATTKEGPGIETIVNTVGSLVTLLIALGGQSIQALGFFYLYHYQVLATLWIIGIAGTVVQLARRSGGGHSWRPIWPIVSAIVLTIVCGGTALSFWLRDRSRPITITTPPNLNAPVYLIDLLTLSMPAYAQSSGGPIVRMALVTQASSLQKVPSSAGLAVAPAPTIVHDILTGTEPDDVPRHDAAVEWLRGRCTKNKVSLLQYLGDPANLCALTSEHPDVVQALMPTQDELDTMKPETRSTVGWWLVHDVGEWDPRFAIEVSNFNSAKPLLIEQVVFQVDNVTHALALTPTSPQLVPREIVDLPTQKGPVVMDYIALGGKPVLVPAGGTRILNIGYRPVSSQGYPEATWTGSVYLVSSTGKKIPVSKLSLTTIPAS